MDILIVAGGMPFGPDTTKYKSLGGSETAASELAAALGDRGHDVTVFAQLPAQGEPDFIAPGTKLDGVRWFDLSYYKEYASTTYHDLLIAQRNPEFVAINTQSRKRVLWVHDVATHRGMQAALDNIQFAIDEVWTVSEWHRQQVHEITGYPLDNIVALRNAIVDLGEDFRADLELIDRNPKQLFYAARPERGLISLIRPGGIMSYLPDCNLKVAMYAHYPDHMRDFYNQIFAWMDQAPNVEYVGALSQKEMRRTLKESVAYVYPTSFAETSCIIAREAIETKTPFLTTKVGALPETLGECGVYFEDWHEVEDGWEPDYDDDEFCKNFAEFIVASLTKDYEKPNLEKTVWAVSKMSEREDLYWDGVAEIVEQHARPKPTSLFSQAWSMVQDGDVIPAEAYLSDYFEVNGTEPHGAAGDFLKSIREVYPFVFGDKTMNDHYDWLYQQVNNDELEFTTKYDANSRAVELRAALKTLAPGSLVVEYGCGAGHLIAPLVRDFPDLEFVGIDIVQDCVDVVNDGAKERGFANLKAIKGDEDHPVEELFGKADMVFCSEVLEHTIEPWKTAENVEKYAKNGGYVLFTVPYGPWEPMTFEKPGQYDCRAHIWLVDKNMIVTMCGDKEDVAISSAPVGIAMDGRAFGNLIFSYKVDHKPLHPVDPVAKAKEHWSRQTCAAAIIAYNNEDTILKMLKSILGTVQHVQIALGPSTDRTPEIIEEFFSKHQHVTYNIIDVPKISPPKEYGGEGAGFGFDDARMVSIKGLEDYEWILWIDTDEYLVGNVRPLLRSNSLDSYLVTQHHFTVEPRGYPAQMDRPARFIRTTSGFRCIGHIHEHFEVEEGGPGRGFLLPNVDIGHVGYENEETRRNRFHRNFPFLEWDHVDGGEEKRKLHSFLWFRDIVHRVRYSLMEGRQKDAFDLANEGIEYYNKNWEKMSAFGPGTFQALDYAAELYGYLNKGFGAEVSIKLEDGRTLQFGTKLESYEQLERVIEKVLADEYKRASSRYY